MEEAPEAPPALTSQGGHWAAAPRSWLEMQAPQRLPGSPESDSEFNNTLAGVCSALPEKFWCRTHSQSWGWNIILPLQGFFQVILT